MNITNARFSGAINRLLIFASRRHSLLHDGAIRLTFFAGVPFTRRCIYSSSLIEDNDDDDGDFSGVGGRFLSSPPSSFLPSLRFSRRRFCLRRSASVLMSTDRPSIDDTSRLFSVASAWRARFAVSSM